MFSHHNFQNTTSEFVMLFKHEQNSMQSFENELKHNK